MKKIIYIIAMAVPVLCFSFKNSEDSKDKGKSPETEKSYRAKTSSRRMVPIAIYNFKTGKVTKLDGKAAEVARRASEPLTTTNSPRGFYYAGQRVATSSNGLYKLEYQVDGDLRLYTSSNVPLWNTKTSKYAPGSCEFSPDGNIYLRSSGNPNAYWWTGWGFRNLPSTSPSEYFYWILQNDGNFVSYHFSDVYDDTSYGTGTDGGRVSSFPGQIR